MKTTASPTTCSHGAPLRRRGIVALAIVLGAGRGGSDRAVAAAPPATPATSTSRSPSTLDHPRRLPSPPRPPASRSATARASSPRSKASPVEPPAGRAALTAAPAQTVELTLPVRGLWGVLQGIGDATHVGYATYALDFVPAEDLTRALPLADRKRLEDFPCFGQPVYALADGEVVWAHDGEVDHPPFFPPKREPGNFVIVRHAPDELTELRHLQRGSLRVKVGERVTRGQQLARCGSSGNAHTPHLHVGFLGSLAPLATRPMQLSRYEVLTQRGWQPGRGVPRTGELVRDGGEANHAPAAPDFPRDTSPVPHPPPPAPPTSSAAANGASSH